VTVPIDLRSDTVTRPTEAVRRAMAEADVGDDVFGDDRPTLELEHEVAGLLGKEAGVFLPSGTMSNLVALLAHTDALARDRPVVAGSGSHVVRYERWGASALGGIPLSVVAEGSDGMPDEAALAAEFDDCAATGTPAAALVLENTHNRAGGQAATAASTSSRVVLADMRGVAVHLDGARLLNAAIALGTDPAALAAGTVSACLSLNKGLGAPAGSVLTGPAAFVAAARRYRKMAGGALHQSGVLAAAGLVALRRQRDRLAEDHEHAALLARGLAGHGVVVEPAAYRTNMVVVRDPTHRASAFVKALAGAGVLCLPLDDRRVRMVMHLDVSREQVEGAVGIVARAWRRHAPDPA
jgi:threonine aldolase